MPAGLATRIGIITLGDYIDLASLTVAQYYTGTMADWPHPESNGEITRNTNPPMSNNSTLLRLIVVGINTYSGINGNGNAPHIVFQFQNLPGFHRMNPTDTNVGGYAASEMRKYLVPVSGVGGTGNFLTGLINAGVPEDFLWAPSRRVWNGSGSEVAGTIEDTIFLPTAWEMFGENRSSHSTYETVDNQGRFAYYTSNNSRMKRRLAGFEAGSEYWEASPYMSTRFTSVASPGYSDLEWAETVLPFAPAFCVK
ncbi:hypothetical protein FACS189494_09530 [Spirochaetia bacterium]|nr:hypothetical protein FACS189494_09530 [Spirochaetia bacterium]